jgi:hypothetical protein
MGCNNINKFVLDMLVPTRDKLFQLRKKKNNKLFPFGRFQIEDQTRLGW